MIQHALDGVSRSLDLGSERCTLRRAEVPQHECGWIHPAGRAPDSYPHPQVVASAERLRDRAQAVVAVVATAVLDPQGAKSMSSSSWTTISWSRGVSKKDFKPATGPPDSFM